MSPERAVLSSPDLALVERQPLLPGLRTLLDPDLLVHEAGEQGMLLTPDCEPGYIRFKPSTSCLIGYRRRGTLEPPVFYATAFRSGSTKLPKAKERHVWPSAAGKGRITIDGKAIEICAFPNDDHLKGIGELATAGPGERMLKMLLAGHAEVTEPRLSILTYKPERRCVFLVSMAGRPTAAIKAYSRRSFTESVRRASLLEKIPGVRFPRVVGQSSRRSLLALEWMEGKVLSETMRGERVDYGCVAETGAALARFHRHRVSGLPELRPAVVSRRLREIVETVGLLRPDLADFANDTFHRMRDAVKRTAGGAVTIHGDFYAKQVLISGQGIGFLDTDEVSIGDGAIDLGNFIAHSELGVLRGEFRPEAAAATRDALLRGYASRSPTPDEKSINLWTAIGLLNVAHEPFRNHRPGWPAQIARLLERVEAVLDS